MNRSTMGLWSFFVCLVSVVTIASGAGAKPPSWPPNYAYSVDIKSLNDVQMSMTVQVTPKSMLTVYHNGSYSRNPDADFLNKFYIYNKTTHTKPLLEWGLHRNSGGKMKDLCWEQPVVDLFDDYNEAFPRLPDLSKYTFKGKEEYHGIDMEKWSATNTDEFGNSRERTIWIEFAKVGNVSKPVPVHMQDRYITEYRYVYGYSFHDFYGFREIKVQKGDSEKLPRQKNCTQLKVSHIPSVKVVMPKVAGRIVQNLPVSFDWRLRGAVSPVRFSRKCGDWAFAVVGAMEGAYVVQRKKPLPVFSEQYLIDCSWKTGNQGCSSGEALYAFNWIKQAGGIPTTYDYGRFNDIDGICTMNKDVLYAPIKSVVKAPTTKKDFKAALIQYGPIVIKLELSPGELLQFRRYKNGVFKPEHDTTKGHGGVVHALVVGYGDLDGSSYWLVKGSFGNWWGLEGYMLLSTDFHPDQVLNHGYYVTLESPV